MRAPRSLDHICACAILVASNNERPPRLVAAAITSPTHRVASMNQPQSWKTIAILAVTQVVSWGSLYYAFAILGPDIERELGWRAETVFGAFSWSLLVAGLASTPAGILLDRYGGRLVMGSGSLLSGLGFILLSHAHGTTLYFLAWTVLGVAMAAVLYEAAFATINHQFGLSARQGFRP